MDKTGKNRDSNSGDIDELFQKMERQFDTYRDLKSIAEIARQQGQINEVKLMTHDLSFPLGYCFRD